MSRKKHKTSRPKIEQAQQHPERWIATTIKAGVALDLPPMFIHDGEPERRIRQAYEQVLPNYRAVLAEL